MIVTNTLSGIMFSVDNLLITILVSRLCLFLQVLGKDVHTF